MVYGSLLSCFASLWVEAVSVLVQDFRAFVFDMLGSVVQAYLAWITEQCTPEYLVAKIV